MRTARMKSPTGQPFLYQPLWCSQEAITESMRIGNLEAFPPQDCMRTVGNRFGRAEAAHFCLCFMWVLGVFHPEDYS